MTLSSTSNVLTNDGDVSGTHAFSVLIGCHACVQTCVHHANSDNFQVSIGQQLSPFLISICDWETKFPAVFQPADRWDWSSFWYAGYRQVAVVCRQNRPWERVFSKGWFERYKKVFYQCEILIWLKSAILLDDCLTI